MNSVHASAYIFVAIAIFGGILAITLRNILHAIFGLALSLFGIAGLFLYLGSPFVAAMEILVYVGGISVAMVFAVMFSYSGRFRDVKARDILTAALPTLGVLSVLWMILRKTTFTPAPPDRDGSVEAIGRALLTEYNLVFEALSVVLLLAIVGAIVIARPERTE